MAVRFVLGRAGSGKTRHCIDALLEQLERDDQDRRLILLVPEQASFQMERALALEAPGGGYWRAEVLSFTRLARRVLEGAGPTPTMLSGSSRAMALRCAAEAVPKVLEAFGGAAGTAGFHSELGDLIEELLREDVSPEALRAGIAAVEAGSRERIEAIARIHEAYLSWLGPERIDAAQQLAVLRERLERAEWLRDASIWVDGFAGFTGQELETLAALGCQAREMTVTLLLDPQRVGEDGRRSAVDPMDLFFRTETTYQRLRALFDQAGVHVEPPVRLTPKTLPRFESAGALGRLEAGLAESPIGAADDDGVRIVACETHRDELRAAARFIRERIADSGGRLRFRAFAVIARNIEPFVHLISDVFGEYEIPHFLDRRRPIGAHALSGFVSALFEALSSDFGEQPMRRLLRSELLPVTQDEAQRLENVVARNAVRGAAWWGRETWSFERSDVGLDAARLRIWAGLAPLLRLMENEASPSGKEWAAAIHETLEQLGVRARVSEWIAEARREAAWESAELHRLAWEALCEVLEDLEAVMGGTKLTLAETAAIVTSGLSKVTLGLAPPTLDQVLISEIERSRHPDIKHAWLLAFNEGVFPARPGEDVLLGDTERDALVRAGVNVRPAGREEVFGERMLAYIAFSRPSHGLTISFARMSADGDELFASPLLADVRRILPNVAVQEGDEGAPPVCLAELARGVLQKERRHARLAEALGAQGGQDAHPTRGGQDAHPTQHEKIASRLDWLLRGRGYRNEPAPVENYRRPGDGGVEWDGSMSEVERYLQCPFSHFAHDGLNLRERRAPSPLHLDFGTYAHGILKNAVERAIDSKSNVREIADEQWQGFLRDAWREFERDESEALERRAELRCLSGALRGFVEEVLMAQAERWRRGGFEPVFCEREFRGAGGDRALAALELELKGGRRVRLHGVIDRADRCERAGRTSWLIHDYKSSAGSVRKSVLTGSRLQLLAYALALQSWLDGAAAGEVVGAMLVPLYPDASALEPKYAAVADEAEQRLYMYRPRGVFSEDAAKLLDAQLGTIASPVANMKLKKDGEFNATSDARGASEVQHYLEAARRTVVEVASGIVAGRIEVSPLVEKKALACRYCDFKPICRFERSLNQARKAEAVLPRVEPVE